MTPYRRKQALEAEIAGLRELVDLTPQDEFATPALQSRLENLENQLKESDEKWSQAPEAELFFTGAPTIAGEGLEAKFASEMLSSFQDIVTNHYAAKHHGSLQRSGRRRGEAEAALFLTALPRGSFGLQLSQPILRDLFTASQLVTVLDEVRQLVSLTGDGDVSFDKVVAEFHPRVLAPLRRFLETLTKGVAEFRFVTGFQQISLTAEEISEAFRRVSATKTDETVERKKGILGGILSFSGKFEFVPDNEERISGELDEAIEDHTILQWAQWTGGRVEAELEAITVQTKTGRKKPVYTLKDLHRLPDIVAPSRPLKKRLFPEFAFNWSSFGDTRVIGKP